MSFLPSFSSPCRAIYLIAQLGSLFLLTGCLCLPSLAQDTLVLELPPSQAARERRAQEAAQKRVPAAQPARRIPPSRGTLPSRRGGRDRNAIASQERVLGRLGMLFRNAAIYRNRSTSAPMLVKAAAGTYIALQQEIGSWYGVLMADGSLGWIRKADARAMDYQVVGDNPTPLPGDSFPTGEEPGDIYPRTSEAFFQGDSRGLLSEAYRYLGVRYVWGGNTFGGIDCSGFVKNVYGSQGYALPRLGSDQMAYGLSVPRDQLQPGDRLYFGARKDGRTVSHTGIYVGNGYFIHASSSQKGVAINHLGEKTWTRLYVCARR